MLSCFAVFWRVPVFVVAMISFIDTVHADDTALERKWELIALASENFSMLGENKKVLTPQRVGHAGDFGNSEPSFTQNLEYKLVKQENAAKHYKVAEQSLREAKAEYERAVANALFQTSIDIFFDLIVDDEIDYENMCLNILGGALETGMSYASLLEAELEWLMSMRDAQQARNDTYDVIYAAMAANAVDSGATDGNASQSIQSVNLDQIIKWTRPNDEATHKKKLEFQDIQRFSEYIGLQVTGRSSRKLTNLIILAEIQCYIGNEDEVGSTDSRINSSNRFAKPLENTTSATTRQLEVAQAVNSSLGERARVLKNYLKMPKKVVFYIGDLDLSEQIGVRMRLMPVSEFLASAGGIRVTMVSKEMAITRQSPAPVALLEKGWGALIKRYENQPMQDQIATQRKSIRISRAFAAREAAVLSFQAGMAGVAAANRNQQSINRTLSNN